MPLQDMKHIEHMKRGIELLKYPMDGGSPTLNEPANEPLDEAHLFHRQPPSRDAVVQAQTKRVARHADRVARRDATRGQPTNRITRTLDP